MTAGTINKGEKNATVTTEAKKVAIDELTA